MHRLVGNVRGQSPKVHSPVSLDSSSPFPRDIHQMYHSPTLSGAHKVSILLTIKRPDQIRLSSGAQRDTSSDNVANRQSPATGLRRGGHDKGRQVKLGSETILYLYIFFK